MSEDISKLEHRDRSHHVSTVIAPNGTIAVVPGVVLPVVLLQAWYGLTYSEKEYK